MSARRMPSAPGVAVPTLPACVLQAPLDDLLALGQSLDRCSVLSLALSEPVASGWRLLDQMRDAFVALREHSSVPIELPVPVEVDGALDLLALRPELARFCGQADTPQVATFVALCKQFDVVPVVPRAGASLLSGTKRGVVDVGGVASGPGLDLPASCAIRIHAASRDIFLRDPPAQAVEIVVSLSDLTQGAEGWRSVDEHRRWLDCLETRECVG